MKRRRQERERPDFKFRRDQRARRIADIRKQKEADERRAKSLQEAAEKRERERLEAEARAPLLAQEQAAREHRLNEARLSKLVVRYAPFANYSDPEFLERYALENHGALLSERQTIQQEYEGLHSPPQFGSMLREREPLTYERATFKVRALALAERLALERKAPKPTPQPPPRPMGNVERQDAEDAERLALAEARLKRLISIRDIVGKYTDLTPDEQAAAEEKLREALEAD